MRYARTVAVAVVLVALATALVGCQQIAEQAAQTAIEKSTGVKVEKQGDGFSVETSQGSASVSGAAEIPADFPASVPVYEPNTVKASVTSNTNDKTGYLVNLESPDDKAKVFDWYKTELEAKGWKTLNTVDVGSGTGGITAENTEYTLLVAIASVQNGGTGTNITLTVTPKTQ